MKQFVKVLNEESAACKFLLRFFLKLSKAKINDGVFVGPQIKKIFESTEFIIKFSKT